MTEHETAAIFDSVVMAALTIGPANRSDLLVAAVTAHAPTQVMQTLLELPDRAYRSLDDVRQQCFSLR